MADDRETGDETRVSAEIPPEEVGDDAAAGQGGQPGDTAESPAVGREGTEIVWEREGESDASGDEQGAGAAADTDEHAAVTPEEDEEPPPPPPPPPEAEPAAEAAREAEPERAAEPEPAAAPSSPEPPPASPAGADRQARESADAFSRRPELYAVGAFAGGFLAAQVLKYFFGEEED